MKKIIILFIAIISTLFFGCATEEDETNLLVESVSKKAILSALCPSYHSGIMHSVGYIYSVDFNYTDSDFFTRDDTVYYKDFAKFAICLATDVYDSSLLELVNKKSPSSYDDNTNLHQVLGFSDATDYTLSGSDYTEDKCDLTEFVISHKNVTYNQENYEIFLLAVQGTNSTAEQWLSNFDTGSDSSNYYTKTGSHSAWTDKKAHKGFSVAAERVNTIVQQYITDKCTSGAKKIIFLTGHSRGAAIVNLLGAKYESSGSFEKTFTYSFATPRTTTDTSTTCKTVFNILNKDDAIVTMPSAAWGFTRYGTDKALSVEADSNLLLRWYYLLSKDRAESIGFYESAGANDPSFENSFAKIASSRSAFYDITSSSEDYFEMSFSSNENAQNFLTQLTNEGLTVYANLSITASGENYILKGQICPAFFMQLLSGIAVGKNLYTTCLNGIKTEKYVNVASKMIGAAAYGGFEKSHLQGTYYMLAEQM
ncbi:MAG: hypothetical protein K6F15_05125 [Treponema sp.]|nr:hypothetical protein [Treponema sp.]